MHRSRLLLKNGLKIGYENIFPNLIVAGGKTYMSIKWVQNNTVMVN